MAIDTRPTADAPDDDPYLWLEEIDGRAALDWVEAQNRRTLARFGGERWRCDSAALTALLDRPDNIPFVRRRGDLLFNFWQDADNPRGVWRTTTMAHYRSAAPAWTVLLDLDALARQEGHDWIWKSAAVRPGDHDRAVISLSNGGSDAVELREFDLTNRCFVDDGFKLPAAKGGVDWLDDDTLVLMSAAGAGMATRSGYARTVRLWQRGAAFDALPVLIEVPETYMGVWASVVARRTPETIAFMALPSFFERETWVGDRSGNRQRLELPRDADAELYGDALVVRLRSPWDVAGARYEAGALLAIGLDDFLGGSRAFSVIFEPAERRVLKGWTWAGDQLVLSILDDLAPVFRVVTPSDWQVRDLAGLPDVGVVDVGRLDAEAEESDGTLIASSQDPLTPPTLMVRSRPQSEAEADWELLKQAPQAFDAAGLVCSRHEAISVDGERIPYFQVGPAAAGGDAPVHLFGYGGFEVSLLPTYRIGIGKLWLERGGTSVIANIRGGGEFGPRWHEAGKRERKRLSHDDFAAVARDLVERGVTRPDRIAAEGGSNGGILISNMFTRYPERFGALFCTIPLIDMRRYNKLLAGASWVAEYGDPDVAGDWAYLKTYSAYHQVAPPVAGTRHPPILLATTRRDDRVHPGHARKMAAKLEAMGHDAYFYEPAAGGHGYGKDNSERAAFTALGFRFLRDGIGWLD